LPAFKVGSDWRFNQESIDRWRSNAETDARDYLVVANGKM
jgi:hypothetical protein